MKVGIAKEVAALKRMTAVELKKKYLEVFGEKSRSCNKDFLRKRIAWRLHAVAEGDISERARRRAEELANDADLRVRMPRSKDSSADSSERTAVRRFSPSLKRRLPMPGTELTREYQGETIRVMVLEKGFEYEGEFYKSLTSVAKKVTGSHWNGFNFFGLCKKKEVTVG